MGTKAALFIIIGTAAATLATSAPGNAQARRDGTDTFQVVFWMSFYGFDWCGDQPLGELYRRALLEKLARCPFPDEAKRRFSAWAEATSARDRQKEKQFIAEHGKLPDRLDGMKETCQEHRKAAGYVKIRQLLERYASGAAKADDVIFSCDTSAGAP